MTFTSEQLESPTNVVQHKAAKQECSKESCSPLAVFLARPTSDHKAGEQNMSGHAELSNGATSTPASRSDGLAQQSASAQRVMTASIDAHCDVAWMAKSATSKTAELATDLLVCRYTGSSHVRCTDPASWKAVPVVSATVGTRMTDNRRSFRMAASANGPVLGREYCSRCSSDRREYIHRQITTYQYGGGHQYAQMERRCPDHSTVRQMNITSVMYHCRLSAEVKDKTTQAPEDALSTLQLLPGRQSIAINVLKKRKMLFTTVFVGFVTAALALPSPETGVQGSIVIEPSSRTVKRDGTGENGDGTSNDFPPAQGGGGGDDDDDSPVSQIYDLVLASSALCDVGKVTWTTPFHLKVAADSPADMPQVSINGPLHESVVDWGTGATQNQDGINQIMIYVTARAGSAEFAPDSGWQPSVQACCGVYITWTLLIDQKEVPQVIAWRACGAGAAFSHANQATCAKSPVPDSYDYCQDLPPSFIRYAAWFKQDGT
ncbi:uncharacterized protein L969DRAFT_93188 [Mixia osmundae IAM 14324]|uniref:uncharacterized protein n=1 Tax=Mixia osmundae (strain CBS 9802 / IAM 14324 / JCM 22182 / KY 12970) TaxID=764103 RepID=UPI0004A5550D|nr:uncharacterized protein L969DRAFT_93188 [Mixia osmundae IAM 14324]KEI40644.1 hypothetical protein L969DRAFT_93188 [Mixia osmundae IAM 14324]